jgi:thioredoxin reductase (NADPH)
VNATRVLIVGAGPIGLETAWELERRDIPYEHVDKGPLGGTIARFPEEMTFFSSPDRLGIAGVPLQTPGQRKCTKEEYLSYLRAVVRTRGLAVQLYEEVVAIDSCPGGGFEVSLRRRGGERRLRVESVVLATGDMARPRRLGIPGEDLPHVSHAFRSPHEYFGQRLLVVGGKNSAVEAALRCWHAGARVTMSYRRTRFDPRAVKYWLLPELEGRIARGEIEMRYGTVPVAVGATHVVLQPDDGPAVRVPADFVLFQTGFVADMTLFEAAGVELDGERRTPVIDARTMETSVPGIYVAGTATAGTQHDYTLFIENCHVHAARIGAALAGEPPPPDPPPLPRPES